MQSGIPSGSQTLFYAGRPLSDQKATLNSFGVSEDDMLLVKKAAPTAGPSGSVAGRSVATQDLVASGLGSHQVNLGLAQAHADRPVTSSTGIWKLRVRLCAAKS